MSKNSTLQKRIGYRFINEDLLSCALTHRSVGKNNNERLEFLGDALLDSVISEWLFHKFPDAKEGELTRCRSSLVRGETLAEIAKSVNLGDCIKLGGGELKSGGHRRTSILADALEAVFAAVYLDSGLPKLQEIILALYADYLDNEYILNDTKDAKTRLQELLQSQKRALPAYRIVEEAGESPNKKFTIECKIAGVKNVIITHGASKRSAEMAAAELAYRLLTQDKAPK